MEGAAPGQALAFGPIPSRRLGLSLGVNVVPRKICSFNCVYCQLGRTTCLTLDRCGYIPTDEVVRAVSEKLSAAPETDYVTVLGDGEPTLASNLSDVLRGVAEVWDGRVALLTNGSTLWMDEVRDAASEFDIVMPTLSAADDETFRRLHRPHGTLSFDKVLDGIREFVGGHGHKTWLEVMMVRGVNDTPSSLRRIGEIVAEMRPAEVHLMAATRPPSAEWVEPPARDSVELALRLIPSSVDFTYPERTDMPASASDPVQHLVEISGTHPLRRGQAVSVLVNAGSTGEEAQRMLADLVDASLLVALTRHGEKFYVRGPAAGGGTQHV